MNWISTKKQFPPDKETVLLFSRDKCFAFGHFLVCDESSFWVIDEGEIINDLDEITHWISLFDLPKPKE